jgi:CheY-like chemotaxis protein
MCAPVRLPEKRSVPFLTSAPVNILLVDDQPAKLLTYEAILGDLGENLIKVGSGQEALRCLLTTDVALALIDVCMPDLDGFELATLIRQHPRFRKIPLIFVSALCRAPPKDARTRTAQR